MIQTRFTALVGCSVPIQQAGMGMARRELAAAVSGAGALGMLGGVMQPAEFLAEEVDGARQDSGAPVGVNFLMPFLDREAVEATAGIGTERAMAAALAAGADAVRVGTRFLAAEEADVHASYVEALLEAGPEDTVLTEAFSTMWPNAPHRVLRSCVTAAEAL